MLPLCVPVSLVLACYRCSTIVKHICRQLSVQSRTILNVTAVVVNKDYSVNPSVVIPADKYIDLIEPFTNISGNPDAIQEVAKHFHKIYKGTSIINRGFKKETATKVLHDGDADLVFVGTPFLTNPDLVERFKTDAALNQAACREIPDCPVG